MALSLSVESEAFRRNIAALQAMTRKSAHATVRDASIMVLQSAAKMTPQTKRAKRTITKAVRRFRHGVEELVIGGRPTAPGDKPLFLIDRPRYRRPISKSGDRRVWVFETMQAARDHQAITFRGIGKAGFWSQFPALGKPIPKGYQKVEFLASVPGIASNSVRLDAMTPTVRLTNSVRGIDRYLDAFEPRILSAVTNRIAGMAKANEKKLERFRDAGGVSFDKETNSYSGMEDMDDELDLPF
jgi:hypothetical protein